MKATRKITTKRSSEKSKAGKSPSRVDSKSKHAKSNLPVPGNETQRLALLRSLNILDTQPEEAFNNLVTLAARICDTPVALVTLVDQNRQWFKANVGFDFDELPREIAFCAHAILKPDEVMIVADARKDPRFKTNPLVTSDPNIRFYAGAPLVTHDGFALGTLCVIDRKPRSLTVNQVAALSALRSSVITEFELRRALIERQEFQMTAGRYKDLRDLIEGAIDRVRDGFVAFDTQMNYTYVNQNGGELLGRKPEDLIGKNYWKEYPEAKGTPFANAYVRALETQAPIVFEDYYEPFDRWFENRIYPSKDGLSIFFTDITEHKRAEERIRQSEESYANLLKNVNGAVYRSRNDQDWTLEYISDGCAELSGYQPNELIESRVTSLGALIHPEDAGPVWEKCQVNLAAQKACSNEYRIFHRNGGIRWVWDQAQGLYSDTGELIYIEGLLTDITERKKQKKN